MSVQTWEVVWPDEPDASVTAVLDADGDVWKRDGDFWWFEGTHFEWDDLVEEYGPLTDATPGGTE
jgi:hypothetical protein